MAFYDSSDAIYGTGVYGSPLYGVVSPNVALTGVSATGSVQTVAINGFEIDISERLNSVSATGSAGTLTVNIVESLGSVSATGSIGTVEPKVDEALGSVSATGAVNTVTVNVAEKLTGVSATFTLNGAGLDIRSINRVPVDGVSGTTALGTIEAQTTEALNSVSAIGSVGSLTVHTAAGLTGVDGELNPLRPFTASGDAQLSTAEKKFGTASLLLDGTGDFVTTSYTSSLLTSSEWAVDFWVYSSTLTSQTAHLWDGQNSNSGFALRISSGTLQVIKDGAIARSVTGQLSNNTWHHIRLQRRFAFTEVFVDGFLRGQQAGAGYNAHTYVIGAKENGSEEFTGYIDEFRASTPTGLSAASFTPETEAYSLDGSTEALLHFDGTNGSTTITNEASNVINLTATGTANQTLTGVSATGFVNTVEEKPTEALLSVSATGAVGSLTVHVVESLVGVVGTGAIGLLSPSDAITVFVASAYDRRNTVHVIPSALIFRSVDSGAAADAYDRTRMVSVLPKQTSNHRRAA